ncbi:unnamed protein product, partial [Prorocentrum cordatum]
SLHPYRRALVLGNARPSPPPPPSGAGGHTDGTPPHLPWTCWRHFGAWLEQLVGTGTVSRRALTDKEDQGLRGASRGSFSRPRTGDCREEKEDARIVGHLMHLRPLREMARDPRFAAGAQA